MRYNYNLSGSGRKPLIDAISQMLGQPAAYQGAPSFSYTVGDYTVDRNGVLSCKGDIDPEIVSTLIEALQERGFAAESVDAMTDTNDTADAEVATENIPETANTTENTMEAADAESTAENTAEPSGPEEAMPENDTDEEDIPETVAENMAGVEAADPESPDILTVEIPDIGFTPEAKENLKKIVASKKTVLEKALGADGLPVIEKDGKLIFPWFILHGLEGEADAYSRLITAICKMAKEQKRVTATEKPIENEKFTMRLFLIRLGFIGDEFKNARKILLRNLSGNSSWKSGHKPVRDTDAVIPPDPAEATLPAPLEELDTAEDEPRKAAGGGEISGK